MSILQIQRLIGAFLCAFAGFSLGAGATGYATRLYWVAISGVGLTLFVLSFLLQWRSRRPRAQRGSLVVPLAVSLLLAGLPTGAMGGLTWASAGRSQAWGIVTDPGTGIHAEMQGRRRQLVGHPLFESTHSGGWAAVGYLSSPAFSQGVRYGAGYVRLAEEGDMRRTPDAVRDIRAFAAAVAPSQADVSAPYGDRLAGHAAQRIDWSTSRHQGIVYAVAFGHDLYLVFATEPANVRSDDVTRFLDSLELG